MILLALGVLLWSASHLARRILYPVAAPLPQGPRLAMAAVVLIALALMIVGYRGAEGAFYWGRSPALVGINNLLMLVSVYCFAAAGMKTALARKTRHLMLIGVVIWMVAHLLVNGDTPSFLLFGGIGLWAVLQMLAINVILPQWQPPQPKAKRLEWIAVLGTLVVYGVLAGLHYAFGLPAFG